MTSAPQASQAPEGAQRAVALTMVRDEADMLPRWIAYYGGQLGNDNLVVLDDNSVDGSTRDLPCTLHRLPPEPWKSSWARTRMNLVNGFARTLLACYDVVVFTDVDEFIAPDPARYEGLAHYLNENRDRDVVAPVGLNVVHRRGVEPPLDPQRPVLSQRRYVKYSSVMCKPVVKRVPANWIGEGFHGIAAKYEIDRDLLLLHLKYYDADVLQTVAQGRYERHQGGRGHPRSAWALDSDELATRLTSWAAVENGDDVPEFDSDELDLEGAVLHTSRGYRSRGRQLAAMERSPLRLLPERFSSVL